MRLYSEMDWWQDRIKRGLLKRTTQPIEKLINTLKSFNFFSYLNALFFLLKFLGIKIENHWKRGLILNQNEKHTHTSASIAWKKITSRRFSCWLLEKLLPKECKDHLTHNFRPFVDCISFSFASMSDKKGLVVWRMKTRSWKYSQNCNLETVVSSWRTF